MSTLTALVWRVRSVLSARSRTRVRRVADAMLRPFGSINGAAAPSQAVALTFDDGPEPAVTPRLLDLLRARGVRATFFVITDRVARHPDLLRRIASDGHEIGLHADRHERFTSIPARDVRRRLVAARRFLERSAGRPVRFFRPPFGAQSLTTFVVARACGLDIVVWGPHGDDWVESPPDAVAARALARLKGGDVLLLHDGMERPAGESAPTFDRVRAAELILDGLAARGLVPATVGDLIASGQARRTAWFRP